MSGIYTVQFNGVAVTAQQDLLELVAAAGKPCVVLGFTLSQTTELGDAAEEQLLLQLKSGQTTSGSGGSAPTPVATDTSNTVAAGFTAEVNNTTKASAGTIVTHWSESWNVRMEKVVTFTQEQQILMAAGRRATLELASTPGDSITMNATFWVQEIG